MKEHVYYFGYVPKQMNGNPGLPNPIMRETQGIPQQKLPNQPNLSQPQMPTLSNNPQGNHPNPPPAPQISPSGSNQALHQQSLQPGQQNLAQNPQNPGQQGQRYAIPQNFPPNIPQNFRMTAMFQRNGQLPQIQMPMYPQQQQAQPQQKKTKKQTQKHPYPIMPKMPPQQYMQAQQGVQIKQLAEPQRILPLFSQLSEEKADAFLRLFDIPQRKTKDGRPSLFMECLTELNMNCPNAGQYLIKILEMLNNSQELFNQLKDPFVPTIFQRTKGTKPSFYILYKAKRGIEYQIPLKERRQNDIIIGTFFTIPQTTSTQLKGMVKVNDMNIQPSSYGETQESFVLFSGEPMTTKLKITADLTPGNQANFIFTFLVVQMVTRRRSIEVAQSLCTAKKCRFNPANAGDYLPCFHPPSCQIDASTLFDITYATKIATCPRCGKPLFLKDLEFDYRQDSIDQTGQHTEDKPELENARMYISDFIAMQMFSTNPKEIQRDDWLEDLTPDPREIVFTTTDEYLESVKQFDL